MNTPRQQTGRGQFGGGALAGRRVFDAAELVDDSSRLGLEREAMYVWGSSRSAAGDLFVHARRMAAPGASSGASAAAAASGVQHSMNDRFLLQATLDGADYPRLRKEGRFAALGDDVERSVIDGSASFRLPSRDGRGSMSLRVDDRDVSYNEGDLLELSGERLSPGLHWYLPMGDHALYYVSQTWLVAGRILGEDVEGFVFVEEAYMPPGGRLYVQGDPMGMVGYRLWYSWATSWDDGTTEFGHFVGNGAGFSVGIVAASTGDVRVVDHLGIDIERAADGYWYDRIALDLDGEPWEIVADPRGQMRDLGPIPNPQQEALVRRVGETRSPRLWLAWGESVPSADAAGRP